MGFALTRDHRTVNKAQSTKFWGLPSSVQARHSERDVQDVCWVKSRASGSLSRAPWAHLGGWESWRGWVWREIIPFLLLHHPDGASWLDLVHACIHSFIISEHTVLSLPELTLCTSREWSRPWLSGVCKWASGRQGLSEKGPKSGWGGREEKGSRKQVLNWGSQVRRGVREGLSDKVKLELACTGKPWAVEI